MAATATRARKPKVVRTPNVQPNNLPSILRLIIAFAGDVIGHIDVPQKPELSENNNVLFGGSITRGLRLPGEGGMVDDKFVRNPDFNATDALAALAFNLETVILNAGMPYLSKVKERVDGTTYGGGNPTVLHVGRVKVTDEVTYQGQVRVTDLGEEKGFSLYVEAFPAPKPRPRGPQITGNVAGLTVI